MALVEKSEFLYLAPDGVETVDVLRKKTSVKRQFLAVVAMDLLSFSYGATCGWSSAAIPFLKSDETPLHTGPITTNEASWIASGICVGGFVGNLLIGSLASKIGQKKCLCIVALPQMLGWILIYYATDPLYLIASRILSGFAGGGMYCMIPAYISEISDDRVRGTFGSTVVFACNSGLFMAYVFGEYVEYSMIPWLMVPVTLAFLTMFVNVPDSPTFLAKKNLYEQAENSLIYFKGIKKHSKYAMEGVSDDLQKLHFSSDDDGSNNVSLDDFKAQHARKSLIYGICLMALNQFCGVFAMMNFTATIFAESGSNLSPNLSAIIVGGIQIIGSMFPPLLVDRIGRKMMMGLSGFGTSIGLAILGVYTSMKSQGFDLDSFAWVPLVMFSFVIFISNWGLMTLPFMIVSEISHPKIRGFVTILCMSCLWVFAFVALKYLSSLIDAMGMHGTMFLFAVNSLIGALFIVTCLPETKGKSIEEIVDLLER